ncbi:cystatin-A5-like [Aquarana catesbeiana]|uniref:cystatin-A5-like n=1 Tax=Aquarana catesbeiana TaxID=8400 RepID=UPI003CCA415E
MSGGHMELPDPKPPTEKDQDILDKVKEKFVEQSKTNPSEFKAILVITLIVNYVHSEVYLFKVYTGGSTYSHLKVFDTTLDEGTKLEKFQLNKTLDDKLEFF